jgi:(p)ppGpp synthase/HD superfamily hydrolase
MYVDSIKTKYYTAPMKMIDSENPASVKLQKDAFEFAATAHRSINQLRKYTQTPYEGHPFAVGQMLINLVPEATPEDVASAYLHDVVEDTPVKIEEIYEKFGPVVGQNVDGLTDVSKPEDGNRKFRKEMDKEHTLEQPVNVLNIKLVDFLHNQESILEYDPDFATVWCREKAKIIFDPRMDKASPVLLEKARNAFRSWYKA